jgi:VCBS repeat-containing protein
MEVIMKKFIVVFILGFVLMGCGSNSTAEEDASQSISTQESMLSEYPSSAQNSDETQQEESNTSMSISTLITALQEAGYTLSTLSQQNALRGGEVDYQTYLYFTGIKSTTAILGEYVYILSNATGQKVLFTLNGPSQFDVIENNSELVLRAHLIESSSRLRYFLTFAPSGFVNINLDYPLATILQEVSDAFKQLVITNPVLTLTSLNYSSDPYSAETLIVCNEQEFALDTSKQSVMLSIDFQREDMVSCKSKTGVLIGSIYNSSETTISGDLFKTIDSNASHVEGSLYTNKNSVQFKDTVIEGEYGSFELFADGNWSYYFNHETTQELITTTTLTDTFAIETTDGTTTKVNIEIIHEVTPEIYGDLYKVISGSTDETTTNTIEGKLYVERGINSFNALHIEGEYGIFDLDTNGEWYYILDKYKVETLEFNGAIYDLFDVSSLDGTSANIKIEIQK